jgi:hypothetical protein
MRTLIALALAVALDAPPVERARCDSAPVAAEYESLATAAARAPDCRDADHSFWSAPRPPGSPCARSIDCAPVCCACPAAGRSALTSWCRDHVCASPAQSCCALLGTPTLSCGNRKRP